MEGARASGGGRANSRTLGELAALVGGELRGDPGLSIEGLAELGRARAGQLSFVASERHLDQAARSAASAFLVPKEAELPGRALIRVPNPLAVLGRLAAVLHPPSPLTPGIHSTAVVAPSARVDPEASVGAFVVIGGESVVEAGAVVHALVVVGDRCRVGAGTVLHPHVVLQQDVELGRGVVVHAGAVLGADGFGYAFDGSRHVKIPQLGRVVVEDDVEIGANVTIDRATFGETLIGRGTKIDNLVQVGHNTVVGTDVIVVAQAGLAGSCRIGRRVMLGGQVGVADHAQIGDGAQVAAQSGVHGRLPEGAQVLGSPALPIQVARRVAAATPRLPDLLRAVRGLERRVAELEGRLQSGAGGTA